MYIKKSILEAAVFIIGAVVLCILAVLYCFTEVDIPSAVYLVSWVGCLYAMLTGTERIARS